MPTLVVPFRGAAGKSRLGPLGDGPRAELAEAMLADVVAAACAVGPTWVVSPDTPPAPAFHVRDPRRGQAAAVRAGLRAAAAADAPAPFVVVNADLPCVQPGDLLALAGAVPAGGLAVAAAADGTTNALALASPDLFRPLYGAGSATRFAAVEPSSRFDTPNLIDDIDTIDDLDRLASRVGPNTRRVCVSLRTGAAA
jgi:2-phospho-L-lactate guanylyltransferase